MMKMVPDKAKAAYAAACASLALLIAPGAVPVAAAQAPQKGGTLVFVMSSDPTMTNPVLTTAFDVGQIGCAIYQGLTTLSPDGSVKPLLAKSWRISEDGRSYSFDLNAAKWQDGQAFTSADVKYSLLEASSKYSAVFSAAAHSIDTIDTPAPDKVVIHLKQPFGPLLISLSCTHGGAILPRHIFAGTDVPSNKASTTEPVGTGAFKLASWTRGDNIRLVRNPDYWEAGKPYLDEVIGKIIPQAAARSQALLAGAVDMVSYFAYPVTDYGLVRGRPDFKLTRSPVGPSQDMMFLNTKHAPLDDKRVRQALYIALNREFILKSAFRGVGEVPRTPFGQGSWFASKTIDYRTLYAYDPKRANAMLDEAGVPRGANGYRFSLRYTYNADDAEAASLGIAVQSMWRAVGVQVTLEPLERVSAVKRVYQDATFDVFTIAYTSYFDPALGLARAWSSATMGKPFGNPTGYSDPRVDDLLRQAANLTDQAQRAQVYESVQHILADALPIFDLRDKVSYDASTAALHGMEGEVHLPTWRDAWLRK
ncbi:hypothetical protein CAL12_23460 [Bordetella genomosp. 8]|uniref:Solute-binding protein family 5 domain-containing protein n=2 Tax=Bordetella genomosp. 8 TaxID=1416806 RepID=A0A1W6YQW6_9BORD|nr:hypothetical protein CAL12_23460 [Bordetella genomosp. 8]